MQLIQVWALFHFVQVRGLAGVILDCVGKSDILLLVPTLELPPDYLG
jgi:hypothetical protein